MSLGPDKRLRCLRTFSHSCSSAAGSTRAPLRNTMRAAEPSCRCVVTITTSSWRCAGWQRQRQRQVRCCVWCVATALPPPRCLNAEPLQPCVLTCSTPRSSSRCLAGAACFACDLCAQCRRARRSMAHCTARLPPPPLLCCRTPAHPPKSVPRRPRHTCRCCWRRGAAPMLLLKAPATTHGLLAAAGRCCGATRPAHGWDVRLANERIYVSARCLWRLGCEVPKRLVLHNAAPVQQACCGFGGGSALA